MFVSPSRTRLTNMLPTPAHHLPTSTSTQRLRHILTPLQPFPRLSALSTPFKPHPSGHSQTPAIAADLPDTLTTDAPTTRSADRLKPSGVSLCTVVNAFPRQHFRNPTPTALSKCQVCRPQYLLPSLWSDASPSSSRGTASDTRAGGVVGACRTHSFAPFTHSDSSAQHTFSLFAPRPANGHGAALRRSAHLRRQKPPKFVPRRLAANSPAVSPGYHLSTPSPILNETIPPLISTFASPRSYRRRLHLTPTPLPRQHRPQSLAWRPSQALRRRRRSASHAPHASKSTQTRHLRLANSTSSPLNPVFSLVRRIQLQLTPSPMYVKPDGARLDFRIYPLRHRRSPCPRLRRIPPRLAALI
ncbi:hypothetical protein R3P38DRAFT_3211104 [Favolaschia claudopus]|uniref:Uncharacterized protein n=1 Tax=Favolaschia claudopus TaxID=2862362 RepID=A0AAW0AGQ1_9AGAR